MITVRPQPAPVPVPGFGRNLLCLRASSRQSVVVAAGSNRRGLSAACSSLSSRKSSFTSFVTQQISSFNVSALVLAAVLTLTSLPCDGSSVLANKPTFATDYATVVRKREGKSKSNLPSAREAEALLEINEDLFTTEALEGMSRCRNVCPHDTCYSLMLLHILAACMCSTWLEAGAVMNILTWTCRIVHYAKFVESLKDTEEGPGCEHCTDNRLLLERAWQVVANEFYDPAGHFSQAKWADQLLTTFKVTC